MDENHLAVKIIQSVKSAQVQSISHRPVRKIDTPQGESCFKTQYTLGWVLLAPTKFSDFELACI